MQCLLCQVGTSYLAIPISHVLEVLRPLPVTRLPDAPSWVLGVAVLRGNATPVVDARRLLGSAAASGEPPLALRWVALRIESRRLALAVDSVERAHELTHENQREVPPLLAGTRPITALGTLDSKLLMVLEGARLLADDALSGLAGYAAGN